MAIASMTGYADVSDGAGGASWTWEARSVNGRGLDLRLRLPDGFEALDAVARAAAAKALARGSVTVGLRLERGGSQSAPRLNREVLDAVVAAALAAGEAAAARGLDLAPMTAADLLAARGVLEAGPAGPAGAAGAGEDGDLAALIGAGLDRLFAALALARASEGRALADVIDGQLDRVTGLVAAARDTAAARAARSGELLRTRVAAVLAGTTVVDEARLAQELALLAVKADVTEELDRLDAHVAAARDLLAAGGPVGRRLDFLMQEFNREANTLCSKAGASDLTAIGLDLKVVVDQMREQVQNVE
ncbi:MAG: YicC/YloC family endoribonuclease [Amaricoccus sp.]|uniref:YicC/YloC family endoribonuclease n=1 Tax=Amaricoccus sp. TaxID=1872485 RepID=UPI0039E3542C